ncbi:MAG TPA: hypothetical protein VLJ19_02005, partial [Variovorax sp.]|nr:hypothetical protein [Variovorax sp.]
MANTHFNRVGSPSSGSPRLRETNKAKPKATPPVREKAVTAFNWPSTLRTPLPERNAKVLDAGSSKTRAAKDVSPPLAKAEAAIPRAQESLPSLVRPHADPLPPLTQDLATEIALPEQPKKAKTKQSPSRERNIQLPAEPTVVERAAPQTPSLSALRTNQNQGPAAASQASQGHRQDTAITRAQPEPVASANPTWRSRLKDFASEAKQLAAYAWSGVKTVSSALQLGVYVAELAAVTVGWGLHKSFKAAYNLGAEFFGAKKIEASLRP